MSNYDLLAGFIDYISKDSWKKYIESNIVPLWNNASVLKEFFETLNGELQGVLFRDLAEKDKSLFLGGVVPNREELYRRNSLAKLYTKFFGLKLNDLQSWVAGGDIAETQLKVIVEKTTLIEFVNSIFKWSDKAVQYQTLAKWTEPVLDYQGLKENPNKLRELIENFYQSALSVSVNYNYYTFFLWSIKQLPYRFMKEAYPRIDQIMSFLETEFGLTEFRWKNPFSEDSGFHKEYTIWCWPEYNTQSDRGGSCDPESSQGCSFGGAVCALNETLWKYLSKGYSLTDLEKIMREYFSSFPYLKEDYTNRVKDRLSGKAYTSIYYRGITAAENGIRIGDANLTVMQMIDAISPYLFTGLEKIAYVGDNYIQLQIQGLT